jgi:hypothetical protein
LKPPVTKKVAPAQVPIIKKETPIPIPVSKKETPIPVPTTKKETPNKLPITPPSASPAKNPNIFEVLLGSNKAAKVTKKEPKYWRAAVSKAVGKRRKKAMASSLSTYSQCNLELIRS